MNGWRRFTSRAFLLSAFGLAGSFVLSWVLREALPFVTVAPVAIGGSHAVNWKERAVVEEAVEHDCP